MWNDKTMIDACKGIIVVVLLIGVTFCIGEARGGDLRLGIMPSSHHWSSKDDGSYNETHEGVFVETRVSRDAFLGFMNYDNSFGNNSNALYYSRDFPISNMFSWGYQFGLVSGYKVLDLMPYSGLTWTFHIGKVHQRTLIIPTIVNGYQGYVEF